MSFTKWELKKGESFRNVQTQINKTDLEFITKYALWREKIEEWESDPQSPGMYASYNDNVMQFLHHQILGLMENETELELLPTYCYFRVYRDGATLEPHKDRPACEVSGSLLIGKNTESSWPLIAENEKITQETGDLLIYRGCEIEHGREPFEAPHGGFQVQLFAHYVDANGPYNMLKGDEQRL